jgi:hypothetical protein
MKNGPKKIVLVSKSGRSPAHDALLRSLIDRKIELFCAVGKDCRKWEDVMDGLCFGPDGEQVHFVVTSSHPQESVDDVISFARLWSSQSHDAVEVIEL